MRQTIAVRNSNLLNFPVVDDNFKVRDVINDIILRQISSEDAFFVLDLGDIVTKYQLWKEQLPRVEPFYAVKCNETECVLQLLAKLGVGFDCASKGEIMKVKDIGVASDRIIYANPCKSNSYLKLAAAEGVDVMTFDNETELYKINQFHPNARLVLRIRADARAAQCPLGIKFGAELSSVPDLLALASFLGLNVVGVSFHVGSGCADLEAFPRAIESARNIFDVAKGLGFDLNLLDIGGGFPGVSGSSPAFIEMAGLIRESLDQHFPESMNVKIIGEPGRFFVASAFTLVTCVIGRRHVPDFGDSVDGGFMYYINDGVYGSFNCVLFDHYGPEPRMLKDYEDGTKYYHSSVWGPTCDSLDCVVSEVKLPTLDVGDWIVWADMGAYTCAAASNFNGFPKSIVHPVIPRSIGKFLFETDENPDDFAAGEFDTEMRAMTLSPNC